MADTNIRRIPTADALPAGPSLRPTGANPSADLSPIYRGTQNLAQGIATLGQGIGSAGEQLTRRQNVADTAAADAAWLTSSNAIADQFNKDNDFATFETRATPMTQKAIAEASKLIADPQTRQDWQSAAELKRIQLVEGIKDRGTSLQVDAQREKLSGTISDLSTIYSDPTVPEATRQSAKASMQANIKFGLGSGILAPADAEKLSRVATVDADRALAFNRAQQGLLLDPAAVYQGMGIGNPTDIDGTGILAAAASANGGKLPDLDPALAADTAKLLGDANFPTDPKLIRAYLSNTETARKYMAATAGALNDRYKGDASAVAVALDPQGGTVLADKWVASKHNEDVLPKAVRDRYRLTMANYRPVGSGDRVPVQAVKDVNLDNYDPAVLDRWELVQSRFGEALSIIPPVAGGEHDTAMGGTQRNQPVDGRGIDVDISTLPEDRRQQLIALASGLGFTGVGIYKDSLHLDAGPVGAWGPSGKDTSIPGYAKDVTGAHVEGTIAGAPMLSPPVDPKYAALTFDQRVQLAGQAKSAMKARDIDLQASIETVAQNAPAAIANTGRYDGDLPTATQFVQAYGSASEGIQRYREFQASMDTAQTIFAFKGESNESIMAQVADAAPTSSGNDAALQGKRFAVISDAAKNTFEARAADPAGYILSAYPNIADDFAAAQQSADPAAFSKALQKMAVAQEVLGFDRPELLPKSMAAAAATQFKDVTLPADQRVAAIAGLVLRTPDEKQQVAIYKQLVEAGVPDYTQGAVAAMVRGDTGAAQNLMRAVLVDPDKVTKQLPANIKSAEVDSAIQSRIFDPDQVGDVVYGITDGTADNLQRVAADSTLITRDVQLHLIDGSAGGDLHKAVDLAIKDMYGDIQTVTGNGVKITLPAGVDQTPYRQGFQSLQPKVRDALEADMRNGMIYVLGKDTDPVAAGMSEVIQYGVENAADMVMANGHFVNAGADQYQFLNPYTGTVVAGADGKPMVFTKAEVLSSGAASAPSGNRFFPGMGGR